MSSHRKYLWVWVESEMKGFGASQTALSYLEGASSGRKLLEDNRMAPVGLLTLDLTLGKRARRDGGRPGLTRNFLRGCTRKIPSLRQGLTVICYAGKDFGEELDYFFDAQL